MKGSALYSKYVIDGMLQELSPAEMLDAVMARPGHHLEECTELIVDETLDQVLGTYDYDQDAALVYLDQVVSADDEVPVAFASGYTRGKVAAALLETLVHKGRFRLCDLSLEALWRWSDREVGNMAAFYESVRSAGDYIDGLNLQLESYSFEESASGNEVRFAARLSGSVENDEPIDLLDETVPDRLSYDERSWVIYIPFDTSEFRLGGSLLAQTLGFGGGVHPQIDDPDYFMDCFEVVHELVEDNVLLSAAPVGRGGMIKAVKSMTRDDLGVGIRLSDIMSSYQEHNVIRMLFGEVPGIIIQVRDIDFDYVDAELLLQDVAYFPLGHPLKGCRGIRINSSAKTGIQTILESLISKESAEGED